MVRTRRGIAVYLVAVLAMILFGVGAVLSFRSAATISSQRRVRHSLESRYLARAGLERSLHHLRHGKTRLSDRFEYGGGIVALEFQPGTGAFGESVTDVLARGTFQELTSAIYAKVELDPVFLKASGSSPESTGTTGPGATGGVRLTVVKHVLAVPGDSTLSRADEIFKERIKDANDRFANELADLSRGEIRWNLYRLAGAVAAGQVTTSP